MSHAAVRQRIEARLREVRARLFSHLDDGERLAIVRAPPGSGKTTLLLEATLYALKAGRRVAIATQTNAQADDICRRLAETGTRCVRFVGRDYDYDPPSSAIGVTEETGELPTGACVVVATAHKWGITEIRDAFDILCIDEAWQMPWQIFMPCVAVAGRFILIGDPGQIPPVVAVPVKRWETARVPPHRPAPDVILRDDSVMKLTLDLPVSRRLPHDSVAFVRGFYDFHFESWAAPDDRRIVAAAAPSERLDDVVGALGAASAVAVTLPTPVSGPPLDVDEEVARTAAQVAVRALARRCRVRVADDPRDGETELAPQDIGIAATHRSMNAAIMRFLPGPLRAHVRVDTPERWQGLERKLMIVIHPLSGVVRPSSFDLETGRLCVMASRHKAGLVVIARDHVGKTLDELVPSADHPLGNTVDVNGQGHARHTQFWRALAAAGRVIAL